MFSIRTPLAGSDLAPFAGVFASLVHGDELRDLRINAVRLADIPGLCGDPQAVACYQADDPEHSYGGEMWLAVDDPDVVHTIVHEYGHHIDDQLVNLPDDFGCGFAGDGSRDWFFARQLEDDILGGGRAS